MRISDRIVDAAREAAQQPMKIIGIVLYKGDCFALAGDAGTLAAAAGDANLPRYNCEMGFHGEVPWFSVSHYTFGQVEKALRKRGIVPSILEVEAEPEQADDGKDPFSSEEPAKAELATA